MFQGFLYINEPFITFFIMKLKMHIDNVMWTIEALISYHKNNKEDSTPETLQRGIRTHF